MVIILPCPLHCKHCLLFPLALSLFSSIMTQWWVTATSTEEYEAIWEQVVWKTREDQEGERENETLSALDMLCTRIVQCWALRPSCSLRLRVPCVHSLMWGRIQRLLLACRHGDGYSAQGSHEHENEGDLPCQVRSMEINKNTSINRRVSVGALVVE